MNGLKALCASLLITASGLCASCNLDAYNIQHDSCKINPVIKQFKFKMAHMSLEEIDDHIECMFQLAFYAYQDGAYDEMIEIFDYMDKCMMLRTMSINTIRNLSSDNK
jgi:hypothetical protein